MVYDNEHLEIEYSKVGQLTWNQGDFNEEWLQASRDLFEVESLENKAPVPKKLEVYALVSGLEFSQKMQKFVVNLQHEIDQILGSSVTRYWVEPRNLGVEYCVFKWPDQQWNADMNNAAWSVLNEIQFTPFNLNVSGIQINRDGCVILKGFDQFQAIQRIRNKIKDSLQFLPKRQSKWAHVPIGRVLDPVGKDRFKKLQEFVNANKLKDLHTELISDAKFVHETQWYMVQHEVIMRIN